MPDRDLFLTMAGPVLGAYLQDSTVIEILINDNRTCYLERFGQEMAPAACPEEDDLDRFLCVVADEVEQEWRVTSPSLHAAFDDLRWRMQASRPPQTPWRTLALRKHPTEIYPLEDFVAKQVLTEAHVRVLRAAMLQGLRVLLGGATGSAKTSILNALIAEPCMAEVRLVILEDDPEILPTWPNRILQRTHGKAVMTTLVKESLRNRPDRVIVGEVRTAAVSDLLWAFRTGHGGLGTLHAESVRDTLKVVESLILQGGQTPDRDTIGHGVDLIMHMEKQRGKRRCTGIVAVDGYRGDGEYDLRTVAEATPWEMAA